MIWNREGVFDNLSTEKRHHLSLDASVVLNDSSADYKAEVVLQAKVCQANYCANLLTMQQSMHIQITGSYRVPPSHKKNCHRYIRWIPRTFLPRHMTAVEVSPALCLALVVLARPLTPNNSTFQREREPDYSPHQIVPQGNVIEQD
jgi:hypothetical protein